MEIDNPEKPKEPPKTNTLASIPENTNQPKPAEMTEKTPTTLTMKSAPTGHRHELVLKLEINQPKKPTEQEPNPIMQHLKQFIRTMITKTQGSLKFKTTETKSEFDLEHFLENDEKVANELQMTTFGPDKQGKAMLITVDTEKSFWELKQPLVKWLTRNGMYLSLYVFGYKDVQTTALGYLKGISTVDTFRLNLQDSGAIFPKLWQELLFLLVCSFLFRLRVRLRHYPRQRTPHFCLTAARIVTTPRIT